MRYHAVIDTNVIVSVALPARADSPPKRIMKAIIEGTIIPIHSDYLLNNTEVSCKETNSVWTGMISKCW